jgi:lysine 6-dehydrogenase
LEVKFLVLGAGKMGYAVAYDLIRSPQVEKVFLADSDEKQLQSASDRLADDRVIPCKMDVSNFDEVVKLMSGCNVAISCVTYKFNYELAKAALEAGTSFVDLGGNEDVVKQEFLLDEFAKERGITIIPDCGLAPGLVSILAAAAAENMDELYEINLRVGGLPIDPMPPLNYAQTFSVHGLINEYVENATIIRNGELTIVPSLEELEAIEFPQPFGVLEAFTTSGGVSTLPKTYDGRIQHLDYKTIRYPGHCAQIKLLNALGLFEKEPININGTSIVPRDLIAARLEETLPKDEPDVVLLRVTVTGVKEKRPMSIIWEAVDYADQGAGLTAMMRMTAFPASILAQMIARNDIPDKGVLVQETHVPTKLFLAELAGRGIALSMLEKEPVA